MEKFGYQYSLKGIPNPSRKEYQLLLIQRTEEFVIKLRWAIMAYTNPKAFRNKHETYNIKSQRFPKNPNNTALKMFEQELWELVKQVEFQYHNNTFQTYLANEKKRIAEQNKVIVKGDKGNNLYLISKEDYFKKCRDLISSKYKGVNNNGKIDALNKDAAKIAQSLNMEDRIHKMKRSDIFIQLKDHKPDFNNNTDARLINPNKQDLGRISNKILRKIVNKIKIKTRSKKG